MSSSDNLNFKIRSFSVVKETPTAFGAAAAVYANEEYEHPSGHIQQERKKIAVFEIASDAERYAAERNATVGDEAQRWLEERALIKLRALHARVEGDIGDIEASVGNVPSAVLKRLIAAGQHYIAVSGGQKFER